MFLGGMVYLEHGHSMSTKKWTEAKWWFSKTDLHFFDTDPDKELVVNYVTILVEHFEDVCRIAVKGFALCSKILVKSSCIGCLAVGRNMLFAKLVDAFSIRGGATYN